MFGTKRARLGSFVAVAGTILGLWAVTAISPIAFAKSLTRLAVERNGETRVIALDGMAQAPYEASRAERPRRIVVDLAGVSLAAAESQPVRKRRNVAMELAIHVHALDDFALVALEAAVEVVDPDAGGKAGDEIEEFRGNRLRDRVAPFLLPSRHDVVSAAEFLEQIRNLGRIVL
jgi:hypothetical protein